MAKEPKLKAPKTPREKKVVEARLQDTSTPPGADVNTSGPQPGEPVDYLRQYQYRKQTEPGSVQSDPPGGSKAARMKEFLLSQARIRMLIPRPQGEKSTITQSVTLNGYRLDFPKDTYVEVPLQVAEVLAESLKQTNFALAQNLIDGNKEKETALL